jgi:hypothetical protein
VVRRCLHLDVFKLLSTMQEPAMQEEVNRQKRQRQQREDHREEAKWPSPSNAARAFRWSRLGPDNEVTVLLRLMGCLCRRPILLSEVDVAALSTLPRDLNPTLLVNQRDLGRRVTRVLSAGCRGKMVSLTGCQTQRRRVGPPRIFVDNVTGGANVLRPHMSPIVFRAAHNLSTRVMWFLTIFCSRDALYDHVVL